MTSVSLLALLMLMSVKDAAGVVIGTEYEQGQAFTHCINITDYQTKTLDDDITLYDREAGGCCPVGTTAGHRFYTQYQGGQIVCGFTADGSYATSDSTSNGETTCVMNNCYVMKQNVVCSTGTQLLNGCCGTTSGSRTFGDLCEDYDYTFDTAYDDDVEYCLTYHTNYGTEGYAGTAEADDDQADGSLVVGNVYTYAACPSNSDSGSGSGSTGDSGSTGASSSGAFSQSIISYSGMVMPLLVLAYRL